MFAQYHNSRVQEFRNLLSVTIYAQYHNSGVQKSMNVLSVAIYAQYHNSRVQKSMNVLSVNSMPGTMAVACKVQELAVSEIYACYHSSSMQIPGTYCP